ncbi:hemolysin family protein [Robiginitalea sp.]|nr:hemolysin family protein [Robiginitalea sp.]
MAIIIISLLCSAFFSGMEIAFVSANRIHIEIEKKQGGTLGKVLGKLTASPSNFITTMLIGNNVALVVYAYYMGEILVAWFAQLSSDMSGFEVLFTDFSLLSQTVISTIVILLTAEFLPKVLFQIYANTLLKTLAAPAYICYIIFWPITAAVMRISNLILRVFFKSTGDQVQLSFTKLELGDYITEQMETVEQEDEVDSEIQIFQNALEFSEVKARDVMVPRTEITAVELHDSPKNLTKLFAETGFSKIVVFKDTIDNIIGYVHSYELFKRPKTIKSILLPVEFVPETMLIHAILNVLTKKRKSMAVVLDEYGGTSGILTVEDIIEELFGEIEDEHDVTDLCEEQLAPNMYKFSARLEVDYLNERYRLELPESDEYGTLGGMILNETEDIPKQDSEIRLGRFVFRILEVSNTKIDLVTLEILESD